MISQISDNPKYDDTIIVTRQILRLGNAIKRDISKIASFYNKDATSKTSELIGNCRKRIFKRLEMIAHVRNDKKINNEKWNQILHGALSQVYKHADTIEFRNRFQSLISIDSHDTSKTGIRFLEEYMKTVARIPEARISRIYHQ